MNVLERYGISPATIGQAVTRFAGADVGGGVIGGAGTGGAGSGDIERTGDETARDAAIGAAGRRRRGSGSGGVKRGTSNGGGSGGGSGGGNAAGGGSGNGSSNITGDDNDDGFTGATVTEQSRADTWWADNWEWAVPLGVAVTGVALYWLLHRRARRRARPLRRRRRRARRLILSMQ